MTSSPECIYIGRNRLHRSRANLIQTLNTVAAFGEIGLKTKLFLPPWPKTLSLQSKLDDFFITGSVDAQRSQLLHPRWKFWPFIRWYGKTLQAAKHRYTRSPEISLALAKANLSHHLEIHDFYAISDKRQLGQIIQNHQQKRIGILISITQATRQQLIDAGADPDRVHVATSGVNIPAFQSVSPFNPEQLADPHLVYIGRMSSEYGRDIFRAIADINQFRITIVGGSEQDVYPNINVASFAPYHEVIRWHSDMTIALMPYQPTLKRIETLSPMKLFEALAAGRPIIASDIPVICEIVTHEHDALLVDPCDANAWISAIDRLRSDHSLAVKISENAKKTAEKYSWPNRAQGILNAIRTTESN
ncbi:glycosyltransferase family 4 protein [Poriferisphaera sp. WC338]|uniref:glycosyltransferase family 4 protein n=1 Tax=Poriferisphaera sp. WC338 TaxID=3425129 RepID=UPI003D81621F